MTSISVVAHNFDERAPAVNAGPNPPLNAEGEHIPPYPA